MRIVKKLGQFIFNKIVRRFLMVGHTFFVYRTYDWAFGKHLDRFKPDIIHAHDGVTLPTAAHAAKRLDATLIFDSHELETHRSPPLSPMRKMQVRAMERKYLPQADQVFAATEYAADFLAQEYKIKRPEVLFNAPPNTIYPVPDRWEVFDRRDIRSDLCLRENNFLFVYTGNITLNRGLELAVIALSKVQNLKDPSGRFSSRVHLAAVGKVQGNQDQAVLRLAEAYGVADRVHILPPVAPHRVGQYVSTANAAIIPIIPVTLSYEMAMPNKLFEAVVSGNPIIGADLVEMGPFITDNELGLTYQADDPDECAMKIVELIHNYCKFERSPEKQQVLWDKVSWENQGDKVLEAYRRLEAREG